MSSFKEISKKNLAPSLHPSYRATIDDINTGSLQRIADAMEIIAKDRVQMEKDLNYYKDRCRSLNQEISDLLSSISGYKGVITRLKNQIKKWKDNQR